MIENWCALGDVFSVERGWAWGSWRVCGGGGGDLSVIMVQDGSSFCYQYV